MAMENELSRLRLGFADPHAVYDIVEPALKSEADLHP